MGAPSDAALSRRRFLAGAAASLPVAWGLALQGCDPEPSPGNQGTDAPSSDVGPDSGRGEPLPVPEYLRTGAAVGPPRIPRQKGRILMFR